MTTMAAVATCRVALIGPPNAGKSTLFNALTGARSRVANWPGTTVELARGRAQGVDLRGRSVALDVVDLPGTHSLTPYGGDEHVTAEALAAEPPDVAVVVIPAVALESGVFLALEVLEAHPRVLVALTKVDVADSRGDVVDAAALGRRLGVPVVLAGRGSNPAEITRGICSAAQGVVPAAAVRTAAQAPASPSTSAAVGEEGEEDVAARLAAVDARYEQARAIAADVAVRADAPADRRTLRVDRIALHPVAGPVLLAGVLAAVFGLTFQIAAPVSEAVGWVVDQAHGGLVAGLVALGAPGWVQGLFADAVLGGIGAVVALVPYLAVFLAATTVLETSGYLARAAVLADRAAQAAGLHGRSLFPLVTAFGCNVPALTATRAMEHRRDRLVTGLIVPFIPCQARLASAAVLTGAFFGAAGGPVLLGLGGLAVRVAGLSALAYRRAPSLRGEAAPLLLELPPYVMPSWRAVSRTVWQGSVDFLRRIGRVLLTGTLVVWALLAVPAGPPEQTLAGQLGGLVAPALAPLGFDWRLVVALLAGLVAKEATLATLGVLYGAGAAVAGAGAAGAGALSATLAGAITPDVGLAFLVVYLLYVPCVATVGQLARELGGARWAMLGVAVNLTVALLAGTIVRQVALLAGLGG
jgi:ferrous iron transport protein B